MNGAGERTTENRGAFAYSVFMDPPFARVGLQMPFLRQKYQRKQKVC